MKRLVIALSATILLTPALCLVLSAQDAAAEKPKDEGAAKDKPKTERTMPALTEITVTGKISTEESKGRDGKTRTGYVLTDSTGDKVSVSSGARGKTEEAAKIKLEDYVGKEVKIVGKGFQRERDGKKYTRIFEITAIEVVAPAPGAPATQAPAAPAAAAPSPVPAPAK